MDEAAPNRLLAGPGFAGDDGSTDPDLARALARYAEDGRSAPVLAALSRCRLLVPVVAMPGELETGEDGPARDTRTDIAAVLLQGRDGRSGLLAFAGLAPLQAWDPQARPVPVRAHDAARAAVQEGAAAIVLDVAGPVTFVVDTAELAELAAGHVLAATSVGYAWLAGGKTGPHEDDERSPG